MTDGGDVDEFALIDGPLILVACVFAVVLGASCASPRMYFSRYGRRHRLCGLAFLFSLLLGFADVKLGIVNRLLFDAWLSILGTLLAVSAALDFRSHRDVKNRASGVLDENATVTYSEMIEHSFYQMLNLAQVLFLHAFEVSPGPLARAVLLLTVTAPWLFRSLFPVNKFSDNYAGATQVTWTGVLYRLKKYQYLLYKHFLLHGLNVSIAVRGVRLVHTANFRLHWMALNAAYVLEFFLQTLVKRGHLSQHHMLITNQLLMAVCTIAALQVLRDVYIPVGTLSLALNVVRRGCEMSNMCVVASAAVLYSYM